MYTNICDFLDSWFLLFLEVPEIFWTKNKRDCSVLLQYIIKLKVLLTRSLYNSVEVEVNSFLSDTGTNSFYLGEEIMYCNLLTY